jgi:hypothetical protein
MCTATMRKAYISAGQYSPFAYQRELTLHRQHDSPYAYQRQQTLPYLDGGYARRPMRKISRSEAFKAPMCTLFNISPDPPVGAPLSVRAPLEHIKGRARLLERKVYTHAGLAVPPPNLQTIHHTVDIGY